MFQCGRMKKAPGGVTMVAVAVLAAALVCSVIVPVASQQNSSSSAEVDQVEGCITSRTGEAVFRVSGVPGPLGPQGPTGSRGRAGAKGGTGAKGDLGRKGEVGAGRQGDQGVTGSRGLKGDTGAPGLRGPVGMPGPPGVRGPRGLEGRRGVRGPRGPEGARGTVGDTGLPGAPGVPGSPGSAQLSPQDHQRIVASVSKEVAAQTISNVRSLPTPSSCHEVYTRNPKAESGYQYLQTYNLDSEVHYFFEAYCEMGTLCGEEGGWINLIKLDMSDPAQTCPSYLVEHHNPKNSSQRACGRSADFAYSNYLSTRHIRYSKMCGRIRGYQHGSPDGLSRKQGILIRNNKHVWGYIAAQSETQAPQYSCPCSGIGYSGGNPIENNHYYCESGSSGQPRFTTTYWDDPLWDGKDCPSGNSCCERYGWFFRSIEPSSDYNVLLTWNLDGPRANEDLYLDLIEIYIK